MRLEGRFSGDYAEHVRTLVTRCNILTSYPLLAIVALTRFGDARQSILEAYCL